MDEPSKSVTKIKWWQYILASVVYLLIMNFVPNVSYIIDRILNEITPWLYKTGNWHSLVFSYAIVTPSVAYGALNIIMKNDESKGFCYCTIILSSVWLALSAFVSIYNFTHGWMEIEMAVAYWAQDLILLGTIVAYAVVLFKEKDNGTRQ